MSADELGWEPRRECPDLAEETVHVWRVDLDRMSGAAAKLEKVLAADELTRRNRLHFSRDARRFTVARGVLRVLLGRYLNLNPRDIRFSYGAAGKPEVECSATSIHFNVTHAGGLALIAVGCRHPLGVDVEPIRGGIDFEGLGRRFFSADEFAQLTALPEDQREAGFFECWTCKEAFIKAIGDGLGVPLDRFTVRFRPDDDVALLNFETKDRSETRWTIRRLRPGDHYVGALAVRGEVAAIHRLRYRS